MVVEQIFYVPYGTEIDDEFLKEHTPHYIKSSEDIDKLPALEKNFNN